MKGRRRNKEGAYRKGPEGKAVEGTQSFPQTQIPCLPPVAPRAASLTGSLTLSPWALPVGTAGMLYKASVWLFP